ncbi:Stk1 family PASTA domain-containing Ser/Thr kinase [Pseudonocardia sp. CA-107938]|uniref:Stk1 family PASTA domain-containing Ser/Thr kinase n=1 Tax=Pseudonocardia sp. CA-107938 TaxID=3240021 RepID=UPI003D9413DD
MTTPRLLSERYELGETLGYGGMSEVHRGLDTRLSRDVAIKVLRADLARDPQFQMRFRREAQNAAALNHPAIVAVYDTGETQSEFGPLPYIVMEYVDGQTLREIIKTTGPMSQQRVIEVMADVCAALDFSHRHQIIHRDVKPANIMINRAGAVKVMDFGIARALGEGQNVTQTAAVIGTAQYLSPEQARGEAVDARSDVYAAGCVLFELLTGEPPFTGDSPVAVAYQHVREDPRRPSELNPSIPPELDAVVLKALSKNPANRYQSAAEMRTDLVRVRSGQAPMAPAVMSEDERTAMLAASHTGATRRMNGGRHGAPPPPPQEYYDDYDEPRRNTGRLIGIVAAVVVALGVIGFVAYQLLSGPPAAQKVTIPTTLAGQTFTVANNTLIGLQLRTNPQPELAFSDTVPRDQVISTNPPMGTQVEQRTVVTLTVSKGPARVRVPNLVGKSEADAKALLEQNGLKVGKSTQTSTTDSTLYNKVVKSDPSGGDEVDSDSAVDIQIGAQATGDPLEDYSGRSVEDVANDLKNKGYKPLRPNGASDDDQVTGTNPPAGSQVPDGGTVQILTNGHGGQGTKSVPDVTGLNENQARAQLNSAGFTNVRTTTQQVNDASQNGKVQRQSPNGGQNADTGSQVTLVIGRFQGGGGGFFGN